MASTRTLNARNLEALGAARLAALLIEVATGHGAIQRRLRLALAGEAGAGDAAAAIRKRLATIARARGTIDWRKVRPLATDLAAQHRAIVELVAPFDPGAALDLLWRFAACAGPVHARSDDGSGRLAEAFRAGIADLGMVAVAARVDPMALAEQAIEAVRDDEHGMSDDLVATLAPALGTAGLERLRALALAWQAEAVAAAAPAHAGRAAAERGARGAARLLRRVADALGDVDGYIAQYPAETRRMPAIAAGIADRLLAAGRTGEAWATIEASARRGAPRAWEVTRLAVLEARGQHAAAQTYRWERFAAALDAGHLRDHLARLPDFEDFDAERRALALAQGFADVDRALAFLIGWPAPARAAALVVERGAALDGNGHDLLGPAADALEAGYPLAATILRRAMIDHMLGKARASRYVHAARHLSACAAMAARIDGFGAIADHDAYVRRLREAHGRKADFWQAVAAA